MYLIFLGDRHAFRLVTQGAEVTTWGMCGQLCGGAMDPTAVAHLPKWLLQSQEQLLGLPLGWQGSTHLELPLGAHMRYSNLFSSLSWCPGLTLGARDSAQVVTAASQSLHWQDAGVGCRNWEWKPGQDRCLHHWLLSGASGAGACTPPPAFSPLLFPHPQLQQVLNATSHLCPLPHRTLWPWEPASATACAAATTPKPLSSAWASWR